MAIPVLFYWLIAYGLFGMVVVIAILNFLLGGLLKPFFIVKSSRGKKILVIIRNPVQDYFVPGEVLEEHLVFKDREGETRRIPMMHGVVSRRATIFWCEVDDAKSCFFTRDDGKGVQTYDAKKTDSLITRALYKPTLGDDSNLIKGILVLTILSVIMTLAVGYLVYKQGGRLDAIDASLNALSTARSVILNNATVI